MIDIVTHVNAVHREVGTGRYAQGEGTTVLMRRRYDAEIADVWDALTTAERINRWFLPVSGELKLGGRYQLAGNAGGEILKCEAPRLLRITWVFGDGPPSEVEVRLTAKGDEETELELEHIAIVEPGMWKRYGPGAVGVGWDGALLGLGLHLSGGVIGDPEEWGMSDEGKEFMTRCSEAWGAAYQKFGASDEEAAAAIAATTAFYTGAEEPPAGT